MAAEHGAAGTVAAQRVADALGVPFLDRALPASLTARVAEREGVGRADSPRVREQHRARKIVRRVFGVDADDRTLYHLIVDTVALGIDASVNLCSPRAVPGEGQSP